MDNKLNLSQLTDLFCEKSGMSRSGAAVFVKSFFETIIERVSEGEQVKVKGFGTFKQSVISDRESVNVNTGERIVIPGHTKITFTPDQSLKDIINKPFENFETIVMDAPSVAATEPAVTSTATEESIENVSDNNVPTEVRPETNVEESVIADTPKATVAEESHVTVAGEPQVTVAEEAVQPVEIPESVSEEAVNAEEQHESSAKETVQPENQQATVVVHTEKDSSTKKLPTGRVIAKAAIWILGIALAALILSYIIWPVSLLHLFRLEADRLTADDNASVAVQVDTVTIIRTESVVSATSSKPEEKIEENAQAKNEEQQDKVREQKEKTEGNDKTPKKNPDAAEPKETAVSSVADQVTKPVKESAKSEIFHLTAADEAKDLSLFSSADTISYRMSGTKTVHTLANGETLTRVSLKYYGTKKLWPYIAAYNHISNVNAVHAGQRLTIPVLTDK